jgi:hypothetical protein
MASNPSHSGSPTTKSIEMYAHGVSSTGKVLRIPNIAFLKVGKRWQLWQFRTNWSSCFHISFQLYCLSKGSNVFAYPGCPASAVSWWSCIIYNHSWSSSGT